MENLPKNKILKFHPNTLQAVRRAIGFENSSDMIVAVDILENWVKQQSHFVKKDFSRHFLEMILVMAKGSLERAKIRLDNLCTFKTLLPQCFGDIDIKKDFKDLDWTYSFMPNLTKKQERVCFFKLEGQLNSTKFLDYWRILIMIMEYEMANDYNGSFVVIIDSTHLDIPAVLSKLNFVETRQVATILLKGFGFRINAIHHVTTSKVIDVAVNVFKQLFDTKIFGKLHIHKSMDSVFNILPKNVFPKDYGGEEHKTLSELHDDLVEELSSKEQKAFQKEMSRANTDESRRHVDTFNKQYMGTPGSFRYFSVD